MPLFVCSRCKQNCCVPDYYSRKTCPRCRSQKQEYRKNNIVLVSTRNKEYQVINRDKCIEYYKTYRETHREEINAFKRLRHKENLNYRLSHNLRVRLRRAIHKNTKTGSAVRDLGCSIADLKLFLESKFQEGMSWDNYGDWHIDHIQPLNSFDLTDRTQLVQATHFTNLQPLWAEENLRKKNKTEGGY